MDGDPIVFQIIVALTVVVGILICAWALVAGVMACISCSLNFWTTFRTGPVWIGDGLERQVEDLLGEKHYDKLFVIGAGIPAVASFAALWVSEYVGANNAWILWFCTWGYGLWCFVQEVQVIHRVRRAHLQKALRGA